MGQGPKICFFSYDGAFSVINSKTMYLDAEKGRVSICSLYMKTGDKNLWSVPDYEQCGQYLTVNLDISRFRFVDWFAFYDAMQFTAMPTSVRN